jgi:hypothetical protein
MKIVATLEVEYDISELQHAGIEDAEIAAELQSILHSSIGLMVGDGGLSGYGLARVEEWNLSTDLEE